MDPKFPQLPFLTREMLKFGNKAKFELQVVAYSSVTWPVEMVGVTREGIIKFDVSHTGDNSEDVLTFQIPDIPISLTLFTDNSAVERGEYYASVYLLINGERVYKLCSGYVSKQSGINFPQTHDESELANGGLYKGHQGANPAAGAEIAEGVPSNEHWILKGVRLSLATDSNVADRTVHLKIPVCGSTVQLDVFSSVVQPADTTYVYNFAPYPHISDTFNDDNVLVSLPPDLHSSLGRTFATVTENKQAGDDYTAPIFYVEQYFED